MSRLFPPPDQTGTTVNTSSYTQCGLLWLLPIDTMALYHCRPQSSSMSVFHRSSWEFKSVWFLIQRKLFLLSCSPVRHALQMEECKKLPQQWEYLYFHGYILCWQQDARTLSGIQPTRQLWKLRRLTTSNGFLNRLTRIVAKSMACSYPSGQPALKPGLGAMGFPGRKPSNYVFLSITRRRERYSMQTTNQTNGI